MLNPQCLLCLVSFLSSLCFCPFCQKRSCINRIMIFWKCEGRGDFVKWTMSFPFDCLYIHPYIFCILSALTASHDHTYVTDQQYRNRQKVRVISSILIPRESPAGCVKPLQQDFTQPRLQVQDQGKKKSKQVNLLLVEHWKFGTGSIEITPIPVIFRLHGQFCRSELERVDKLRNLSQ